MNKLIKAFIKASGSFKKPKFNNQVSYGGTKFAYADLSEILDCVAIPLRENGIALMQLITYEDEKAWVKTLLMHEEGDQIEMQFPISIEGAKMQDIGKQITYIKRYSIAALCGLCADEDTDAIEIKDTTMHTTEIKDITMNTKDSANIAEKKKKEITILFNKLNAENQAIFFMRAKTNKIETLSVVNYEKAIRLLIDLNNAQGKEKDHEKN